MKRIFLLMSLIFIFLFPLNLQGSKFYVKIAFGIASGGNVDDILLTQTEYSDYISMGEEKRPDLGQDIYLEFIYQVNPYLSFSVGNGYTSKMLKGKTAQFTPPASSKFEGDYTLSPRFSFEAIPIYFSAIFTFPVRPSIRINFTGGVGYYFGTFESKSEWRTNLPGFSTWEYRSWNFKGKANTIGYHLGAGFDLDLSLNLYLTVDALYRVVNFNNIESSGEMGVDTTLVFIKFYEGEEPTADLDYRVSRASLTGPSFRVGLKVQF